MCKGKQCNDGTYDVNDNTVNVNAGSNRWNRLPVVTAASKRWKTFVVSSQRTSLEKFRESRLGGFVRNQVHFGGENVELRR